MDMSYAARGGGSKVWLKACKMTCGMQVLGGLVLSICSSIFLFGYGQFTGQVIGALLVIVGGIGLYGSMNSHRESLNLHLLGVLLAMMMAFNFIGQVVREMDVDCALAEMYVRGLATEDLVKKQHESEIFNSLYTRLNEMEDMMHGVETGAYKRLEHKKEQEKLRSVDNDYIMAKLEMLHDHAEELVRKVVHHESVTNSTQDWTIEEEEQAHRLLDACERIIKKVRGMDEDGKDLGQVEIEYEEYEAMLSELAVYFGDYKAGKVSIKGDATHLHQAIDELPNMKGAMDRLTTDQYHHLKVGAVGDEVEALDANAIAQSQRRDEWVKEFEVELAKHKQSNQLEYNLEDLPEHCMVESKGRLVMTIAGVTTLISQVVSGYCVLTTLFKIPVKFD